MSLEKHSWKESSIATYHSWKLTKSVERIWNDCRDLVHTFMCIVQYITTDSNSV